METDVPNSSFAGLCLLVGLFFVLFLASPDLLEELKTFLAVITYSHLTFPGVIWNLHLFKLNLLEKLLDYF